MKYNFGTLLLTFATLTPVHGINFGTFINWFQIRNKATVSGCKFINNRRKCKLDAKSLQFDNSEKVELNIRKGGRTIICKKAFNKRQTHWYGSCDGDADDANFITRFDKNGRRRLFGSIHVGNEICHIGPNIDGDDEILCIPKSDFQAEDDPRLSPNEENPENLRLLANTSDMHFGFTPIIDTKESPTVRRGSNHHDNDRLLFDDSGANIDVLVVWTKLAECSKAGLAPGCTVTKTTENMMRGLIDLAVAETNTAYALSGIFTSLRLVHAYRDPDYVEGDDFYTSLKHVTTPNDGFMDSVHSKRALYGADAVHMIAGRMI